MTDQPNSLIARVWRRKLWFTGVTLGSLAIAAAILISVPVHYVARGAVIVGEVDGPARAAEPVDIQSQAALIRSPRLVRAILGRPGVLDAIRQDCLRSTPFLLRVGGFGAGCNGGIDGTVDRVARNYMISPVGASRVVDVSYQGATPETAQGMANFLIDGFLAEPKPTVAADRRQAVARLRQDVATLETAVKDDETKLAAAHRAIAARNTQPDRAVVVRTAGAQQAMNAAALRMKAFQRGIGGPPDVRAALDARSTSSVRADVEAVDAKIAAETGGSPMARSLRAQLEELRLRVGRDAIPGFRDANRAYLAAAEQPSAALQMVADVRQDEPADLVPEPASIERTLDLKRQLYVDAYRRASALEAEPLPAVPVNKLVNLAEGRVPGRGVGAVGQSPAGPIAKSLA